MSWLVVKSLDISPKEVKELCDETWKLFLSLRRLQKANVCAIV